MFNKPVLKITKTSLERGDKSLWHNLSITIQPGEFIAVLGPNGAGKTSLVNVILGLLKPDSGRVTMLGQKVSENRSKIGYVPQQKYFDPLLPIRGRDLVKLGADGHHLGFFGSKGLNRQVSEIISKLGASDYANLPIGLISGGEQQRLRVAQALVNKPRLLVCDEPLLSLDLASQQLIVSYINRYRQDTQAAIIFVTHDINPILPFVDLVIYLANGKWLIDKPNVVLNSQNLSRLYGAPVEVIRHHKRILVIGSEDQVAATAHHEEI